MLNASLAQMKLHPRRWLNVLWILLLLIYLLAALFSLPGKKYPASIAGDYQAFYATAQIALSEGFAQVYNLRVQDQFQTALQAESPFEVTQPNIDPVPMPYLPAFVLLFLPLPFLGYVTGFILWDLVNFTVLIAYLYRLNRAMGNRNGLFLLFQLVVCIPVASNMLLGQINVFMVVCMGEFLLASIKDKEWLGGLWLGGLLLKPQLLIFILPGLLIGRRYKVIAGFTASSAVLLGLSLILVGPLGLRDLVSLILQYVPGLPTNAPEVMMNWRAFAVNLGNFLPKPLSWALAFIGIIVTTFVTISLWRLPLDKQDACQTGLLLLATFAGTLTVAWHAHNHMEMILIPIILFTYSLKILPWKILYLWLLAGPLSLLLMYLLLPGYAYNLYGIVVLIINLVLLFWASRSLRARGPSWISRQNEIENYA
jgi:hypothetical protein